MLGVWGRGWNTEPITPDHRLPTLGTKRKDVLQLQLDCFVCLFVVCCCCNRTDLGKRTHQYEEKQGDNDTRALSTEIVFFGCKKIDGQQKKK